MAPNIHFVVFIVTGCFYFFTKLINLMNKNDQSIIFITIII